MGRWWCLRMVMLMMVVMVMLMVVVVIMGLTRTITITMMAMVVVRMQFNLYQQQQQQRMATTTARKRSGSCSLIQHRNQSMVLLLHFALSWSIVATKQNDSRLEGTQLIQHSTQGSCHYMYIHTHMDVCVLLFYDNCCYPQPPTNAITSS
mmetsp:Transcript_5426/g.15947  ORF Transcript_5426/g.15947 Transcript_5426/m.15947 type:complete len:150 (-) Transcript_5426:12-461(-)